MNCRKMIIMYLLIVLTVVMTVSSPAASADETDRTAALSFSEKLDRGLQLWGWIGGWEADYTREAYEAMASYKGLEPFHFFAGFGHSDQVFYEKDKVYAKGYYFFRERSYAKLALSFKDYDYPDDPDNGRPNPDSTSYDKVPAAELELQHWFTPAVRGTVFTELYRPSFFYDTDKKALNVKAGGDIYYITPLEYLRGKLMIAVLRDPDPDKTEIQGRDNPNTPKGTAPSTDVKYQTSFLAGGAIEFVKDRWEAEIKVLPNRDLDSSYKYSFLTYASYRFTDELTGRLDYVHDKYSSESSFSGETANVYMVSAQYKMNDRIDIGAGFKHIDLPESNENTGFFSIRIKTGLLL